MLEQFILSNRAAIIALAQAAVAKRTAPKPTEVEVNNGIPVFLDQLGAALHLAKSSKTIAHDQLKKTASEHGHDLFLMGLTIDQVVHDYGDVCQAVTQLAMNQEAQISSAEFQVLNLCLDDAIAGAVTEYGREREDALLHHGTERLGIVAQELRNVLSTAIVSFESIKSGRVSPGGSTGAVLSRSLLGLRDLIDRSFAEVRLERGAVHLESISVADFVAEVEIGASLQARANDLDFAVTSVDRTVTVEGDRQFLAAAIANLLQNAFKFTHKKSHVSLSVSATPEHVLFEVEDECGGLPPGKAQELLLPVEERGANLGGVGLGLPICLKAAKANGGEIRIRDLPGKGCVFALELPRNAARPVAAKGGKRTEGQREPSAARTPS